MSLRDLLALLGTASPRRVLRGASDLFKGPEELNLTEGSIGWPLFYLSLPIVLTNLLQTAYNLADTFWLGRYSTEALAAISFSFPLVFLLFALGIGLSVAGSVLVAQHVGADEEREAEYAAAQTVAFSAVASLSLGLAGFLFVDEVIAFLGASADVVPLAAAYMRIISLGIVFMFEFFVFVSLMRGSGDTVTPMLVMFGTVALNVVLDPFLIFGWGPFPEMAVAGAAVATVVSRAMAMVVGLWIMYRGERGIRVRIGDLVPDPAYARKLVRVGAPASVEVTGRALSVNALLLIVGLFPTTVVAAYGVGARLFSVIFLPAIAVAQGVETMTGQNVGAGEHDRAAATNRFAAAVMFAILFGLGAVVWFVAEPVVGLFTADPRVVAVGADFLRIVAPSFGFIGVMRSYTGGFRGAGKTLTAAALAVTMLGVVRLPVAWVVSRPVTMPAWLSTGLFGVSETLGRAVVDVLAFSLAEQGIWLAFDVSNVIAAALAFTWFMRGTWREADPREGPEAILADD